MSEYVKIEAADGRRYDTLHCLSHRCNQTLCGIILAELFDKSITRTWYVTTNPNGHKKCATGGCKEAFSRRPRKIYK